MRDAILGAETLVSAVTVAEVSIKTALGKLTFDEDLWGPLRETGVVPLPFTWDHARALRALPPHHRDPFDRMLIAQAQVENLTLVSVDAAMTRYDVSLLAR